MTHLEVCGQIAEMILGMAEGLINAYSIRLSRRVSRDSLRPKTTGLPIAIAQSGAVTALHIPVACFGATLKPANPKSAWRG